MEFSYNFLHDPSFQLKSLTSREGKEITLQWGLENSLKINRFKIEGGAIRQSDHKRILDDFFSNGTNQEIMGLEGIINVPIRIDSHELKTTIRSMEFFDRLTDEGIVSPTGSIMGCFDRTIDGIMISDRLRDVLVDPESESASLYSPEEKNELIYLIFKILCVGGALNQPDNTITRYLEFTKLIYKELLILYKASDNGEIRSACNAYSINAISGLDLYPSNANRSHSHLIVVINQLEKYVVTVQLNNTHFW